MPPVQAWNKSQAAVRTRWRSLKSQRPGIAHAANAYQRYKDNHGDHLAAAITYFSFLALFPLIFLVVSVTGFVLTANPHLLTDLIDAVHRNVPGDFGNTLSQAIESARKSRTSVGLIGIVGLAWAGLGWIANLRTAIDTVWGAKKVERSFLQSKALDALVLVGLGLGVAISLGLTVAGTAASAQALKWIGWSNTGVTALMTKILAIAVAILGDLLVFSWLLVRLPQVRVSRRTAIRTALLAAVGFEILKLVGTYYLARLSHSPAAAALGTVIGILIFIDLVLRYLLYCAAWAATASPEPAMMSTEGVAAPTGPTGRAALAGPAARVPAKPSPSARETAPVWPLGVAIGLFSAGVALGGAAVAGLQRRRHRPRATRQPTP